MLDLEAGKLLVSGLFLKGPVVALTLFGQYLRLMFRSRFVGLQCFVGLRRFVLLFMFPARCLSLTLSHYFLIIELKVEATLVTRLLLAQTTSNHLLVHSNNLCLLLLIFRRKQLRFVASHSFVPADLLVQKIQFPFFAHASNLRSLLLVFRRPTLVHLPTHASNFRLHC
jgi:hypothetical protein